MNIYAFSYCTYTEYVAAKDKIGALSFYNADNMAIMKTFKDSFMKYSGFEKEEHFDRISFYNGDCMDLLKQTPDKYYDLCIVDPPYGIGMDKTHFETKSSKSKAREYGEKKWDTKSPDEDYFKELMRVSKNQIIWGANHFISKIPFDSSCWVVWDKDNGGSLHADCELAYTSFKTAVRKFTFKWQGMLQGDMKNKEIRIHPTQKPIKLYDWLLNQYASEGDLILDTHLGSGSIAIAIDKANTLDKKNLTFVGIELDPDYYLASVERFKNNKMQKTIFNAIQD
jgi:site-specific DNA-methyltransferase (adenine-specific)